MDEVECLIYHTEAAEYKSEPPHQSPTVKISEQSEEIFLTDFPSRGSLGPRETSRKFEVRA